MTEPNRVEVDAGLVRRLVAAQFPQWAGLPVTPVVPGGWDNRTFRLGEQMSARLPSAAGYVAQVVKEHRWLPRLAPHLPLAIPTPLAMGEPAQGYPWSWSVYRWLEGETAAAARTVDRRQLATALAEFLLALQRVDAAGGPPLGPHNFFRGGPLTVYDRETRQAIEARRGRIDAAAVVAVWEAALAATWHGPPVWLHGDVSAGNLLLVDGRLRAVIDFGCVGVGDPACDLTIAWTLLDGESRDAFRAGLALDDATWARGRGWSLWKALIVLAGVTETNAPEAADPRRIVDEVVADHQRFGRRGS